MKQYSSAWLRGENYVPCIDDLYLAWRQAKTALFYERRGIGLVALAEFEADLAQNLNSLHRDLSESPWFSSVPVGKVSLVPKSLRSPKTDANMRGVASQYVGHSKKRTEVCMHTRVQYAPSPQAGIVEVLYLWKFGPLLDSLVPPGVVGHRLDLQKSSEGGTRHVSPTRRWLFQYWPRQYNKFRTEPVDQAASVLGDSNNTVTVLSSDFRAFYESIDASFLTEDDFVALLRMARHDPGDDLISDYRHATESLLGHYDAVRQMALSVGVTTECGIPIGALTSRVVANVFLLEFDRHVLDRPEVVCYRRYVDDFVIVARTNGKPKSPKTVIRRLIPVAGRITDQDIRVDGSKIRRPRTDLVLHADKSKVHVLRGDSGREYLKRIRQGFDSLVSNRVAFVDEAVLTRPRPESLLRWTQDGQTLTVLRDADRPKLEAFSMHSRLESLERISKLVAEDDTSKLIQESVEEASWSFWSDDDWVKTSEWAFRLLSIALVANDWDSAKRLSGAMHRRWGSEAALRECIGSIHHKNEDLGDSDDGDKDGSAWRAIVGYLRARLVQTVVTSLQAGREREYLECFAQGLHERYPELPMEDYGETQRSAGLLAAADLRVLDRQEDGWDVEAARAEESVSFETSGMADRMRLLEEFTEQWCWNGEDPWRMSAWRLFSCTRPMSYFDVAVRRLWVVSSDDPVDDIYGYIRDVVNAVRGTEHRVEAATWDGRRRVICAPPGIAESGLDQEARTRLVLGSVAVAEAEWEEMVAAVALGKRRDGRAPLSRFDAVARSIEEAVRAREGGRRRALLVLPELAMPGRWVRDVACHSIKQGHYGLVAGVEYITDTPGHARNVAVAVLPGQFHDAFVHVWHKGNPAREEGAELSRRGVAFASNVTASPRAVVESPYGRFSVLICSELLEAEEVADLAGRVELVIVPASNQDTATFDEAIRGAGRLMHSYVALANNRRFSDSRVWAPEKPRWREEAVRVVDREGDAVVRVTLPLGSLRRYHEWQLSVTPGSKREWHPLPPGWPKIGTA